LEFVHNVTATDQEPQKS